MVVGVRPEDVEVVRADARRALRGTVAEPLRLPLRDTMLLTIRVGEHEVHAQTSAARRCGPAIRSGSGFKHYHLFDKASGERLRSHRPLA